MIVGEVTVPLYGAIAMAWLLGMVGWVLFMVFGVPARRWQQGRHWIKSLALTIFVGFGLVPIAVVVGIVGSAFLAGLP